MQFFLSRRVTITATGSKFNSAVRNLKTEIMAVLNFAKSAFGFIQQYRFYCNGGLFSAYVTFNFSITYRFPFHFSAIIILDIDCLSMKQSLNMNKKVKPLMLSLNGWTKKHTRLCEARNLEVLSSIQSLKKISKGRVARPTVSTSMVGLQYWDGR